MKLVQFIKDNKNDMLQELNNIIREYKKDLINNPNEYTELGCDEPTIDIRLCIDLESHGGPNWIFRIGLVDYDTYFSEYCAENCITLNSDASGLFSDLVNQLD